MQSWSIPPINPPIKIFNPPIKILATINPINSHGSIPIKTHHQPDQYPRSIPNYHRFCQTQTSCPWELRHGVVSGSRALWFAYWDRIGDEWDWWDRWEWDQWDRWPKVRSVDWGRDETRERWEWEFSVWERGEVRGERNKY